MSFSRPQPFDPRLDLLLERVVDVPVEKVWAAWTIPEQLMRWFTPAPWSTVACELDLRPGGRFHTVMRSPDGQEFPNTGCFLEVIEYRKLIWTSVLEPGYRPAKLSAVSELDCADLAFTAVLSLEPVDGGTRYSALALHRDESDRKRHEDMGFHDGWGKALDQLVEHARGKR